MHYIITIGAFDAMQMMHYILTIIIIIINYTYNGINNNGRFLHITYIYIYICFLNSLLPHHYLTSPNILLFTFLKLCDDNNNNSNN